MLETIKSQLKELGYDNISFNEGSTYENGYFNAINLNTLNKDYVTLKLRSLQDVIQVYERIDLNTTYVFKGTIEKKEIS